MGCCFKKPEYQDMGECYDVRQKRYLDRALERKYQEYRHFD